MNPNLLIKASPEGAMPIASFSGMSIFAFALSEYLKRYLPLDGMTRDELVNNLRVVEDELATMLGKLHAAGVPDYKVRAEMVASELNHRLKLCKLDQPEPEEPDQESNARR